MPSRKGKAMQNGWWLIASGLLYGLVLGWIIWRDRRKPPISMVLHCPRCGGQHIDKPTPTWSNPPHKSHLCDYCGTIWRPAAVETVGVQAIASRGKADNWPKAFSWRLDRRPCMEGLEPEPTDTSFPAQVERAQAVYYEAPSWDELERRRHAREAGQ